MKKFKDNAGHEWMLDVEIASLRRVRKELGINLASSDVLNVLARIVGDPILLCDVLYVLCKPQADAHAPPISDEDFGRAMAGDAIQGAAEALTEAVSDFIPNPKERARALRVMKEIWAVTEEAQAAVDVQLDRLMKEAKEKILRSATSGPQSAASSAPSGSPSTT